MTLDEFRTVVVKLQLTSFVEGVAAATKGDRAKYAADADALRESLLASIAALLE